MEWTGGLLVRTERTADDDVVVVDHPVGGDVVDGPTGALGDHLVDVERDHHARFSAHPQADFFVQLEDERDLRLARRRDHEERVVGEGEGVIVGEGLVVARPAAASGQEGRGNERVRLDVDHLHLVGEVEDGRVAARIVVERERDGGEGVFAAHVVDPRGGPFASDREGALADGRELLDRTGGGEGDEQEMQETEHGGSV